MNKQKSLFGSFISRIKKLVSGNPSALSGAAEPEKDTFGNNQNVSFPNRNEREFNRDHWPPDAPWF